VITATLLCLPVLLGFAAGRLSLVRIPPHQRRRALTIAAAAGTVALVIVAFSTSAALNWACWYTIALVCGWELGALPLVLR
jgi:hypothetical protein